MSDPTAPLDGYTIAFDLDGTLVDTIGDLHRALNHVLGMENLPLASMEDVRAYIGQGARALIIRACGVHGVHPSDMKIDLLTEEYLEAYASNIAAQSAPFPGVVQALENLKTQGATLCVCTNKGTRLSNQLLETLDLAKYFAAVIGADQLRNRKPHPDHYLFAIRSARGVPARSLMIGDSINDVQSAKSAGAPVAIYAHGYTDTAPDLLGADAVFKHFEELPDLAVRLLHYQPTPRV